MLQWSIRFKEFTEFIEFPFYLGKTPLTYILHIIHIYRPQKKFAKVMFLHVSVILSRGGYPSMHCRFLSTGDGGVVSQRAFQVSRSLAWGQSPGPPWGGSSEVWGGVSKPTPMGKLRSITWGVSRPSRQLLLRPVRILLECIPFWFYFRFSATL